MNRKEVPEIKEEIASKDILLQSKATDKLSIRLLWISLLLGFVFTYFFYKKPMGVSYPLFILLFYGVFIWFLRIKISFAFGFSWFLSLSIVLLAFTYFFFSNRLLLGLNFLMIPVLIIGQTILLTNENRYHWFDFRFLLDLLHGFFVRLFAKIPRFFTALSEWTGSKGKRQQSSVIIKVVIGLLISIPLLALVLLLLTSADIVFGHYLTKAFEVILKMNLADLLMQFILLILVAILLFSYLDSFIRSMKKNEEQVPKLQINTQIDSIILMTVLGVLILVYIAFILIQFRYMFGGSISRALPVKLTYAEYARRGFFELVAVTLINFTILLVGLVFQPNAKKVGSILVRVLQSLLVICTVVMLVSAFMRMSLYESQFGYTYLRVLTHAFMIFLFVLFIVALLKIWNRGVSLFQSYVVISLVAYLIINYINIDVFITKKNLERYDKTGLLDAKYLTTLSYDSLPIVLHYHLMKDLPRGFHNVQVHQKVLVSEYFKKSKSNPDSYYDSHYSENGDTWLEKNYKFISDKDVVLKTKSGGWPAFNLSKYLASKAIMDKLNITEERYRKLLEK